MQPDEYVRKGEASFAIQLKEDNLSHVLDWLQRLNIQYSHDEIKSGGMLIVYDPNDGPKIVNVGWWIVMSYDSVYVFDAAIFNKRFELRTP